MVWADIPVGNVAAQLVGQAPLDPHHGVGALRELRLGQQHPVRALFVASLRERAEFLQAEPQRLPRMWEQLPLGHLPVGSQLFDVRFGPDRDPGERLPLVYRVRPAAVSVAAQHEYVQVLFEFPVLVHGAAEVPELALVVGDIRRHSTEAIV